MTFDLNTLIWLFPIAFILHDFEELLLFEPWLKKNAGFIQDKLKGKVPAFFEKQVNVILDKSTTQFVFPISLIFILVTMSAVAAVEFKFYPCFFLASSLFFLHGFMHIGQAILLRHYVPALITSVLIVFPYGAVLFWALLRGGIVNLPGLVVYFLASIILAVPFIIGMHIAGEVLHKQVVKFLIG